MITEEEKKYNQLLKTNKNITNQSKIREQYLNELENDWFNYFQKKLIREKKQEIKRMFSLMEKDNN